MPAYARRQIAAGSRDVAVNALGLVARKLAEVKQTAAANTAAQTEYTLELPKREATDHRPESERAVSVAIIGDISHDHQGNPTGLTGRGHASHKTGSWVKL
jgi:hypothetical protein